MRTHLTQIVLDQNRGTISGATTDNARGLIAHLNAAFAGCERRFVLDPEFPFRQMTPDDHFGQGPVPSIYPSGDVPLKILMRWQPDQVGAGFALSNPAGDYVAKLAGPFFPSDWDERQGVIFRGTVIHETLHTGCGVGMGDWTYRLFALRDPTATLLPPGRRIWGFDENDWFHSRPEHRDWDLGFMSGDMSNPNLRMDELSRRIALGEYRFPYPLPPLANQFSVIIRDRETKEPVKDAKTFVIHIDIDGQGGWRLLNYTGNISHFRMPWSVNMSTLYSEPARLLKVYAPGYRPGFAWYCVGDAQAESMTGGSQMFVVEMDQVPSGTLLPHPRATGQVGQHRGWINGLIAGEYYVAIRSRPGDDYPQPIHGFVAESAAVAWQDPDPPKDGVEPFYSFVHLPHALIDALPPGTPPPPPGPRREMPERVATCEICNPPQFRHITEATPAGPRRNV